MSQEFGPEVPTGGALRQGEGYVASRHAMPFVMRAAEVALQRHPEPDRVTFVARDPANPTQDLIWEEERYDTIQRS